jgi:hypothetical protein
MYFECGALAFIPDKSEPDTDGESDALTYTGVHCLHVIFKWGMLTLSTMLDNLISLLAFVYSIRNTKNGSGFADHPCKKDEPLENQIDEHF